MRTGKVCGSSGLIERVESALGHILRLRRRGPKPRKKKHGK
jgi:hypothetical protein